MSRRSRSLTFKGTHWGTDPLRVDEMTTPEGAPAVPIAAATAVSYSADKGGKPEVFRHPLTPHDGRGPFVLEAVDPAHPSRTYVSSDQRPTSAAPSVPPTAEMCGIGIDFELADGRLAFLGDCLVTYDQTGEHDNAIYLHWGALNGDGTPVPFALETRPQGPFMTDRGIEE